MAQKANIFMTKALSEYQSCKFILYGAGTMMKVALRYAIKLMEINIEMIIDKSPSSDVLGSANIIT